MLRPSPPRISRAIARRGPGVQPPARCPLHPLDLFPHPGAEHMRVPERLSRHQPGGRLPPDPPPDECDWGRNPQKFPARPSRIFHREPHRPARPPHTQGNRTQGSGGATPGTVSTPPSELFPHPGAESERVPENPSRHHPGACRPLPQNRDWSGNGQHTNTLTHHFSQMEALLDRERAKNRIKKWVGLRLVFSPGAP